MCPPGYHHNGFIDIALCLLGHIERSTGRAIAAYALCARSLLAV